MKSPCNKVCVMDVDRGYCKGCFRTLEEIGRWASMTEEEQARVLGKLAERRSDVSKIPVPPLS